MPLDTKTMATSTGSEISAVWVLPAALQQLQECGESALVEELIVIFQTDTADRLEVLARAVEAADYAATRQEAHTIKGSALQVGAIRMADVCREMEVEARKPAPEELPRLFQTLLRRFEEVREVFATGPRSAADGPPSHGE